MAIIITYDLDSKHTVFKEAMFKLGYKDHASGLTCKKIYFPNTTLYHSSKDSVTAREDAKNIAKKLEIELERCIATKWSNWAAICGEEFK